MDFTNQLIPVTLTGNPTGTIKSAPTGAFCGASLSFNEGCRTADTDGGMSYLKLGVGKEIRVFAFGDSGHDEDGRLAVVTEQEIVYDDSSHSKGLVNIKLRLQ